MLAYTANSSAIFSSGNGLPPLCRLKFSSSDSTVLMPYCATSSATGFTSSCVSHDAPRSTVSSDHLRLDQTRPPIRSVRPFEHDHIERVANRMSGGDAGRTGTDYKHIGFCMNEGYTYSEVAPRVIGPPASVRMKNAWRPVRLPNDTRTFVRPAFTYSTPCRPSFHPHVSKAGVAVSIVVRSSPGLSMQSESTPVELHALAGIDSGCGDASGDGDPSS